MRTYGDAQIQVVIVLLRSYSIDRATLRLPQMVAAEGSEPFDLSRSFTSSLPRPVAQRSARPVRPP